MSVSRMTRSGTAAEGVLHEAQAVVSAAGRLREPEISAALGLLGSCSRLTVVIGMGVSGLVAAKLAATFTSSGTPSAFLHASNALHGGLGVARSGDVAIAVSNSGRTPETVQVAARLRESGIPVLVITGDLNSPLAAEADVVLDTSVAAEACPLGALPTASSTIALTLGDALAMALSERHGWTHEDLARVHPYGQVGHLAREQA